MFHSQSESLIGLSTSTTTRVLGTSDWEHIYNFYDVRGRLIRSHKVYHPQTGTKGYTIVSNKLDFRGKPDLTRTVHRKPNTTNDIEIVEKFTYDHQERLVSHTHKIGSNPEELIAYNNYNQLGQILSKKVGGTDHLGGTGRLQSVDYKYNIRGWLTDINSVATDLFGKNAPPPGTNDDLFAFKIAYNEPLYNADVDALYNGNIAQTYWKTSSDNVLRGYFYEYDQMTPLRHAYFDKPTGTPEVSHTTGAFDEWMLYDKNGNIQRMVRQTESNVDLDDLNYTYQTNSNLLKKVTDATNNTGGFTNGTSGTSDDYTYDANGNMVSDKNKGITNIVYNHIWTGFNILITGCNFSRRRKDM